MVMKLSYRVFFFVLGASTFLQVAEANIVSLNPRPRLLGMGGAGLGAMGDYDSASVNPAGLADVQKYQIEYLPMLVEVPLNLGLVDSFQNYKDATDGTDTTAKRNAYRTFLSDVAHEALGMRVNVYPNFTKQNFHLGVLADFNVNPRLRAGGMASNQVVELGGSNGTAGVIIGYAHSFMGEQLQVGITAKPLYRIGLTPNQTQTVYDIAKGMNAQGDIADEIFGPEAGDSRAFGFGVDLGAKYSIPFLAVLKPSVGLTWQDVGDTRFFTSDTIPENIPQSLSAGVAIHPSLGIFQNTLAVDFRDINRKIDPMNKIHIGLESKIWKILALRAGLSQMYWTVGANLDFWLINFDVYVAAQEAGRYAHIQEQRTLGFKFSLGI